MYFSNIANAELQHFHRSAGADFSISLTEILHKNNGVFDNKLFKVEEIITDSLYKVYPLFYCSNIISSNPYDKNLDNNCLILQKKEHETYLSFMTNEDKSKVILIRDILKIKKIGDDLSTDEFNALVYLLRKNGVLNGNINFEETAKITGIYGTYEISDNNQLRNDTGFIVNNKTKNNPLTITLTNPFFLDAKYTLTFTVRSLTGANVCIEEYEDYKITDTFSIELIKDVPVSLDLTSYVNDSVLDFNVDVSVSFDVPEIINSNFGLELTSNHELIFIGESLTLTATLSGEDNVRGYTVQFFEDNVLIGSQTTDNNGEATFNRTPDNIGDHIYSCKCLGLTATETVNVKKHTTTLSLTSNKNTAYIPTTFTVTGTLTNETGGVNNAVIKLYNNNDLIDTLRTDSTGAFSKTITADTVTNYNLKAVFEETSINKYAQSDIINVTARKLNNNLSINTNKSSMYYTESVRVNGVLKDEFNNIIPNAQVKLLDNNNTELAETTTNNNGEYVFNKQYLVTGQWQLKTVYAGDESHNTVTSNSKSLKVNNAPVNITISPIKEVYYPNDEIQISLASNYGQFNASKIIIDGEEITGTNNSFNYKVKPQEDNTLNINYTGNSNYQSNTKNYNIDNYIKIIDLSIGSNGNLLHIDPIHEGTPSDHEILQNYDLRGLTLFFGNTTRAIFDDGSLTNDDGEYIVNISTLPSSTTIYAVYGDVISNTVRKGG